MPRCWCLLVLLSVPLFGQAVAPPGQPTYVPSQVISLLYLFSNKVHFAGTWSAATTYGAQDLVLYNGNAYISLVAGNTGNTPSNSPAWWIAVLPPGTVDGQMLRWNATAQQWQPVKIRHSVSFAALTTITVLGSEHQLGTADVTVTCYDTASPPRVVEGDGWTVDPATFDVVIRFATAQDGKCVLR